MEEKQLTQKEQYDARKQVADYKKKLKEDTEFLTIEAEFFFASLKHAELKQKYVEVFRPELLNKPTEEEVNTLVEEVKVKEAEQPKAKMTVKSKQVELNPEE